MEEGRGGNYSRDNSGRNGNRNQIGSGGKIHAFSSSCLSIWALLARSSFYKILSAAALMATAEVFLFLVKRRDVYAVYGMSALHVGEIFYGNKIKLLFLSALFLVIMILLWTEDRLESQSYGTIMRLRITRQQFFGLKTIYNVFCLLMVFVVQIALVFWMLWQCKTDVGLAGTAPQVYFFAFYSNRFLHCLLPMAEFGKWVRNTLILTAWGMQAAGVKGKGRYVLTSSLVIVTIYWFDSEMGVNMLDIAGCIISVLVIGKEILCVCWRDMGIVQNRD